MFKSSFTVVFVSFALVCIVKEITAVEIDQPQNSEITEVEIDQPQNSATTFKTEIEEVHDEPDPSSSPDIEPIISPFEVVTTEEFAQNQSSDTIYKLPSGLTEENGNWSLASGFSYTFVIPLCPELKTGNIESEKILEGISEMFPNVAKCLFVRKFKKNETRSCDQEPQFVIEKIREKDGSSVICGINDNQQLVEVQYHNCGSEMDLQNYEMDVVQKLNNGVEDAPPFEPRRYTMYQICYDFQNHETLWTKHKPMTPALLINQESPYKKLSNEFQIENFDDDASSLDLADSTFKILKKAYGVTDDNVTTVFTMVPKEHMALLYWKKATTHMANSAPLRPAFIPLMKAINNGILQASNNLFLKSGRTLQIYTKAETILSPTFKTVAKLPFGLSALNLMSGKHINLFEPNIWCLLVYDAIDKSGILIVLHNTNEELDKLLLCNNNERLSCDFISWSDSPEFILDEVLNYAYCCKISGEEAEVLFSIKKLEFNKTLHIQSIISGKPIEPLSNFGTDVNAEKKYL